MNRGELRTFVAQLCEDVKQTKFTQAMYHEAIKQAERQFSLDSKALYSDSAITMVVGTASYSLPSDFMLEKEVTLNGLKLNPISRATLQGLKTSSRWDEDEGTPQYFIIDPEEARKHITLYPKPDSAADGTSLVLTYYPVPAEMSLDSSIPLNSSALMTQFHIGLAHYAAWLLLSYLSQTPEISQKRGEFYNNYFKKVEDAIQTFGNTKSEPISFHVHDVRVR